MKQFLFLGMILPMLGCIPSPNVTPPNIVVIQDFDAAVLRDPGPDASPCAKACASFATPQPPCREAFPTCIDACENAYITGIWTDLALNCLVNAHDRPAIQQCGSFCP